MSIAAIPRPELTAGSNSIRRVRRPAHRPLFHHIRESNNGLMSFIVTFPLCPDAVISVETVMLPFVRQRRHSTEELPTKSRAC